MAEIRPFRAWRFNEELSKDIYKNPYNSIHLSVPSSVDDAAEIAKKWKEESIILQDQIPGIYVYYQYFSLAGQTKEYCRKGFICNIRAYDWDEGVLLRHENSMPHSVNDRIDILTKTQFNVSPTPIPSLS
mgnify:CR=1 FL=1